MTVSKYVVFEILEIFKMNHNSPSSVGSFKDLKALIPARFFKKIVDFTYWVSIFSKVFNFWNGT